MARSRIAILHAGQNSGEADAIMRALAYEDAGYDLHVSAFEDAFSYDPDHFDWLIVILDQVDASGRTRLVAQRLLNMEHAGGRVIIITDDPSGLGPVDRSEIESNRFYLIDSRGYSRDQLFKMISSIISDDIIDEPNTQQLESDLDIAIERNVLRNIGGQISFNPVLFLRILDWDLSVRTFNSLKSDNIIFVGDLIQHTEAEMLRIPNFGRKSLNEIKQVLAAYELALGSNIPGWPPPNFEEMANRTDIAFRAQEIRQAPLGVTFEARRDLLVIAPIGDDADQKVSERSTVQQLHADILRKARGFASAAARLDNQVGWQGISSLCDRLTDLLNRPTNDIPEVLGSLYGSALELGSFFEMDQALRRGPTSFAAPLDPEAQRPLEDLLRSFAPWLRSFPTVRELDDEAGQFLMPPPPLSASAKVIETADKTQLVSNEDARDLRSLLDAAARGDFQGAKAGRRGFISARNMIVAVASVIGGLVLGDYATKSVLIGKAGAFLAEAETAIVEVVSDLPADIRLVIEGMLRESGKPILPPSGPDPVVSDRPQRPRAKDTEDGEDR